MRVGADGFTGTSANKKATESLSVSPTTLVACILT